MSNEVITTATGHKVQVIEIRTMIQASSGATWKMILEKYTSPSGKTTKYLIYHEGGQSYPIGEFRSRKIAVKMLDSFSNYTKVVA